MIVDHLTAMTRRDFLKSTTLAGAAVAFDPPKALSAASGGKKKIIDCNVTLSRCPFRRLPLETTAALARKLRGHGITQAWAGTFDGLFHKDLSEANARLANECAEQGGRLLVPFGSINPVLPDWETDLELCVGRHRMPGIRLHPNYHDYALDDPRFAALLDRCQEHSLIVQLVICMEDERTQHPRLKAPHVDAGPLLSVLQSRPRVRVMLLNWFRAIKGELLTSLAGSSQIWFDLAMVEGVGGVEKIGISQMVFGSHAPFFYVESALLKLKESALSEERERTICRDNAERLRGQV